MEDIRRQDIRLFLRELRTSGRILGVIVATGLLFGFIGNRPFTDPAWIPRFVVIYLGVLIFIGFTAYSDSIKKRFHSKRMQSLWAGCQDRMTRFEEVLRRMRRDQLADLKELPKTIRGVSEALYIALRRADLIADEVAATEAGLVSKPPVWQAGTSDAQSQELYRLADKNIAEYRSHFSGVMAGVQRTEAQSAVFMTTLDTLRMKLIGYRLVGRSPEMGSHDFLAALAEARAQLEAIDTALEELDLGHYPKTIAVVPPAIPADIELKLRQARADEDLRA